MDKNTEQFKWDDKLAMELCEFVGMRVGKGIDIRQQVELLTEVFKQSKSKKEEPQWEILSFKNLRSGIVYVKKDNGKFNSGNGLDWDLEKFDIKDHEIINSVKRFPDNTVWSVDMVTAQGKIKAFKIFNGKMFVEIYGLGYEFNIDALTEAPKEEQVPHRCKYCNALVASDSDEGCYANPNRINEDIGSEEKQEEQVPIKKEIIAFGRQRDPNGFWYEFYSEHPIPTEKYQSIKSAIKDVLNNKYKPWKMYQTGFTSEELLQARRDAFSSGYTRGWHNGCFEEDKTLSKKITDKKFEDYINSLK